MPRCFVFGASGRLTSGTLRVANETICTLRKVEERSQQMEGWDTNFPATILPNSQIDIKVTFCTRKSLPFHLDWGTVDYEVMDNAGLSLATFKISADASESTVSCCCCWTFKGRLQVDWQTLPKVFGVTVEPREGDKVGFKKNGTVNVRITGKVLPGGHRDERSEPRLTEWAGWEDMAQECRPGDVVGVDRGAFRHYGVVNRVEPDGTIMLSHLVGTAGGLLSKHGLGGGVKEVWSALSGSHGDIAGVTTEPLSKFAAGNKCRVENLHEDHWKAYSPEVLANRMAVAEGFRDYSLFEFNCEHYANLIRYGMPYSEQVEALKRRFDMAAKAEDVKNQITDYTRNISTDEVEAQFNKAGQFISSKFTKGTTITTKQIQSEWSSMKSTVEQKFNRKEEDPEVVAQAAAQAAQGIAQDEDATKF